MVSEHIVLGPSAGAGGIMGNPRDYAMPGNQDPAMPWPSSLVLLSAIAAATTRLRLAACAVIAPLRHPLLLARELGTLDLLSEGRLVVQPTVSWHRDEYEALGVPFAQARRPPRRAPGGVGGPLARHAGVVRRRALRLRGRLPRAEGLASRRPAALARRRVGAPAPPAPDRPLRPRLPSARTAVRRRPGACCATASPPRAATSRSSSSSAACAPSSRTTTARPRSTPRSIRSRRSSSAASRRSASSRRSSSTTSPLYPAWCREVVERVGEVGG